MARFPLRVLGIVLLTLAISVPGCQALFAQFDAPARTLQPGVGLID